MMKILVTGGAGYVGSTVCSALIDAGHTPVIIDSLINGSEEFTDERVFYRGDLGDTFLLERIFDEHPQISCVIHCAALAVVPESVECPYEYYHENISKPLVMLKKLCELGCMRVIFSSTAALYGDTDDFMVTEESPLDPRSPYARTKYMLEMILEDFCAAYGMRAISLRYFNLIGADPKFRSGPYIKSPSHLLGKLIAASNAATPFMVTGTDWPTRDGTGIRDYLHVWDLAKAHVAAAERFDRIVNADSRRWEIINLSNGKGVTVREFVAAFESVTGREILKEDAPPRPGDIPGAFAAANKAKRLLGWQTELDIGQGIADSLAWDKIFNQRDA